MFREPPGPRTPFGMGYCDRADRSQPQPHSKTAPRRTPLQGRTASGRMLLQQAQRLPTYRAQAYQQFYPKNELLRESSSVLACRLASGASTIGARPSGRSTRRAKDSGDSPVRPDYPNGPGYRPHRAASRDGALAPAPFEAVEQHPREGRCRHPDADFDFPRPMPSALAARLAPPAAPTRNRLARLPRDC